MEQPQRFISKCSEAKVLKLRKILYGLKPTPQAQYNRIGEYFTKDSRENKSEQTLYIKTQGFILYIYILR